MNIEEHIDSMRDNIIKSVQEIVRIRSVEGDPMPGAPFGQGVSDALSYALNLASSMGFMVKNLGGYIGYAEYGEGDEVVGVLGHLDVVPEGSGWTYEPYSGTLHEGRIYSRGTEDDKGPIIAALYALKAVRDSGLPLNKKVRVIFGCDEESGCVDIKHYLEEEKAPDVGFTPDGLFPVINAEKGSANIELKKDIVKKSKGMISIVSIKGGSAANMVPDYCECELKLKDLAKMMMNDTLELYCDKNGIDMSIQESGSSHIISSRGTSSHSSTPENGRNAITQLLMFLSQFNLGQNDVSDFIKFITRYIGGETNGKSLNIAFKDDISGELTLNLGRISIDEEKASAVLNIRYPIGAEFENILKNILETAADKRIDVSVLGYKRPLYIREDDRLISTLLSSYNGVMKSDSRPVSIGGQTYAKSFNNMAAFGPVFPGSKERAHMPDEFIDSDSLIRCAKIYADAIYKLAK